MISPLPDTLPCKKTVGFTLIELSMVLIIIGLISGGILVGRELIYAAEIRATIKQYEDFSSAANTFRLKYGCLPGDCSNPADFGFDAATAGNGDGIIGECSTRSLRPCSLGAGASAEHYHFWYHLGEASLIKHKFLPWTAPPPVYAIVTGVGTPPSIRAPRRRAAQGGPGGWSIQADTLFDASAGGGEMAPHAFVMAVLMPVGLSVGTPFPGGYSSADMALIDQKIDDGKPVTGKARAWTGFFQDTTIKYYTLQTTGTPGPASNACVSLVGGEYEYNVQYTGTLPIGLCNLNIIAAF